MARLPWECLYDSRQDSFLLISGETTVVRFREQTQEPAAVPVRLPLRVLVAAERPLQNSRNSRESREAEAVCKAIRALEAEGVLALQSAGSVLGEESLTRERLGRLVERDVDVAHLIVGCRREMGRSGIVLRGESGEEDFVDAADLGRILKKASPRLIVLSGGEGAGAVGPELAQELLETVPAVVYNRGVTPNDLISRFAESFYRALGALKPLDAALCEARGDVATHFPLEGGWLAPALFVSRKDASVFFSEARERVQKVFQLSEGRYRRVMRETLNHIWPKPERYHRQLLRWLPRQEPLTSLIPSADFLGQAHTATDLLGRFQRLFLMGEPGAGKTMTLYRLFYETAQPIFSYSAKSPLPVYLSFPDVPARTNLVDFISEGLDRELFLKDLEEGRFLFLMDALDGLSAAGAKRLTALLNEFMRRYPMNRFVVAARRQVPGPLDISNWIEIVPFAEWEALDFLIGDGAMRAEPAKLLYRQLAKNLGARVGNTQVLTMARRLWRDGARIPANLSGLYLAFYQVAGASLAPELREGLLPKLAFFMNRQDRTSIKREHLEAAGGQREPLLPVEFQGADTDELLTELSKTRLLRGPNAFGFPSIGFQEFLAAMAMRSLSIGEVVHLVQPAEWDRASYDGGHPENLCRGPLHGAIALLNGLLEDGSELVEKLIERDLLLAAQCYREGGSIPSVSWALRSAIGERITGYDPLGQRVGCLCLEAVGDSWAIGMLEQIASNPASPARTQALEGLGKLRSGGSMPLLKAAALEKDPVVVRAALDALGRIKIASGQ